MQELALSWIIGVAFAMGGSYWLLIHIGNEGKKIKVQQIEDGKEIKSIHGKIDVLDERSKNIEARQKEHHETMTRQIGEIHNILRQQRKR